MGVVRLLLRAIPLGILLIIGLFLAFGVRPFLNPQQLLSVAGWFHRRLLNVLNVRVTVPTLPTLGHGLMVSNHISWLDIVVLGGSFHTFFVSKDEVRKWPLVGSLAKAAGTLFISRGNHQAQKIRQAMADRIGEQTFILFFPEGTTFEGIEVNRFHPRLFGAAIEAEEPVLPVALRYEHSPQPHPVVPYVGDDVFFTNLLKLLMAPKVEVTVHVGKPIPVANVQRKELATQAQQQVADLLGVKAL